MVSQREGHDSKKERKMTPLFERKTVSSINQGQFYDDSAGNVYVGLDTVNLQIKGGITGNTTFGTVAHAGVLHGAGTSSSSAATNDTAGTKFMSYYLDCGATSDDARGLYLRLYLTGAGGGGEAARIFTTVNNVAGATAHGAHISLSFGTTGSITGQGIANRNTLHVPAAMTNGTYAATQSEIYSDSATADLAGVTEQSFHRFVNDGNATGKGKVDATGNLFSLQGFTVGSGKLFQANTAAAATHALRITIGSTPYYIMLTDTGA